MPPSRRSGAGGSSTGPETSPPGVIDHSVLNLVHSADRMGHERQGKPDRVFVDVVAQALRPDVDAVRVFQVPVVTVPAHSARGIAHARPGEGA